MSSQLKARVKQSEIEWAQYKNRQAMKALMGLLMAVFIIGLCATVVLFVNGQV